MAPPDRVAGAPALRRPRNLILLGLLVFVIGVRIALPFVLRPLIVSEADAALAGRIALADLDLSLLRGGVTLHGLEVHADELPPPAAEGAPAPELEPPLFEAQRLWTQISWLALLRKTLEIEEFELTGFSVRLDRLDAGLVLPGAAPSDAPPEAGSEEPLGWSFALDSVAFRDGMIVFRDFTVRDAPQQFDLAVEDISASDLALATDASGLDSGHIVIAGQIGGGTLALDAKFESLPGGPAATAKLAVARLPITGGRVYLTMFGWSDLSGTLDAVIDHRFETGGAHEIAGSASLSDVVVSVPNRERPALAWKRLAVGLEKLDLVKQRVAVSDVALSGARIVIDPQASPALPVLTRALAAIEAEADAPPAAEPADDASPPWSWRVAKLRVSDSRIDLLGAEPPLPIALALDARGLASGAAPPAPVELSLTPAEGSLALAGALGIEPLAFAGELKIADLALAPLLSRVDAPAVGWLREGKARAELRLALAPGTGAAAGAAPMDLKLSGTLGLAGIDVAEAASAKDFRVSWKDLAIGIRQLSIPELIAPRDPAAPLAVSIDLDRVRLLDPSFRLTRTRDGILLPPLTSAAPADAADEPQPPQAPADGDAPGPVVRVTVADARIENGRARIVDPVVEPRFTTTLKQIELKALRSRWPGPVIGDLALSLRGLKDATLVATGDIGTADSRLDVKLAGVPLARFNRYVKGSGYDLGGGALALETKATIAKDAYETSNQVVVSHLDVSSEPAADSLFQKNFGIPLSVAVGLLEDLDGNIDLAIPLAGDRSGTKVGIAGVIGQALRKALVGALAAPLKLLGAVVSAGTARRAAPEPIACEPGRAEFSEAGDERIEELASLLSASPAIGLTLSGATAPPDVRWLAEQALLEELRASSGLRALGSLGEIGTRRAVREYLEARHAGGEAPLEPEPRAWLEAQLAEQSVPPAQLAALAAARAAAAQAALATEYAIDPKRLTLGPPLSDPPTGAPGVEIALGTWKEDSPQAEPGGV